MARRSSCRRADFGVLTSSETTAAHLLAFAFTGIGSSVAPQALLDDEGYNGAAQDAIVAAGRGCGRDLDLHPRGPTDIAKLHVPIAKVTAETLARRPMRL
jgi:hypothetical protein